MGKLIAGLVIVLTLLSAGFFAAGKGWLGSHEGPGIISDAVIPQAAIEAADAIQATTTAKLGVGSAKQILFGDLHVHTTKSYDAFVSSLPMMNGEGAHPVADACDFARFCSALDFWSITDHAEASTPVRWQETVESIRQCNAVSGTQASPDTVAFLGWEWTQVGSMPDNHYGHRNVIIRDLDDGDIPERPINSGGVAAAALGGLSTFDRAMLVALAPGKRQLDFSRYVEETRSAADCDPSIPSNELPADCRESATTPQDLFRRLDETGHETMVIPHGTTWGFYTPAGSAWDKQLINGMHDPDRQPLIEIMSGHGNSEEYRPWRGAVVNEKGQYVCPEPSEGYLPSCWRAGEIIADRCRDDGRTEEICAARAAIARQDYINIGIGGHIAIGGEVSEDWQDAGQCTDCFLPSFNYRPGGAVQYIMALTNFTNPTDPQRFRFGFMASSDNHTARPGTGYKEFGRRGMADALIAPRDERIEKVMLAPGGDYAATSINVDLGDEFPRPANRPQTGSPTERLDVSAFQLTEAERQASFFLTGGLIATHAAGRDRNAIWNAVKSKEVYGTSGDRILLWFDLENGPAGKAPMGSEQAMQEAPEFTVRAAGAFKQKPGCPEYASEALTPERLDYMCRGECYNPSDERKLISRIEVVRILPQNEPGEDITGLIADPWRTHICEPDPHGCTFSFSDEEFPELERDALYYVRAIESPSLAVNAGNVRCERDEHGRCVRLNICYAGNKGDPDDDCLELNEERAWSSPIFVDWE